MNFSCSFRKAKSSKKLSLYGKLKSFEPKKLKVLSKTYYQIFKRKKGYQELFRKGPKAATQTNRP